MIAGSIVSELRKYFLARGIDTEIVPIAVYIFGDIVAGPYNHSSFTVIRARSTEKISKLLSVCRDIIPPDWIVDATKAGCVLNKDFLRRKVFWAVNRKLPSDKLNTLYDLTLNNPISVIVTLDESDNIVDKSGCILIDLDRPQSSLTMATWGDSQSALDNLPLEQQEIWLRTNLELNKYRVPRCNKNILDRFYFKIGDSHEPLHDNNAERFHTLPMILEAFGSLYNPFMDSVAAPTVENRNPLESPEVCKSIADMVSKTIRHTIPLKLTGRTLQVYEAMQELESDTNGHTTKEILARINEKGSDIISLRTVDRGRQELLRENLIEKLESDRYKTVSSHKVGNTVAYPEVVYLEATPDGKHPIDATTSDENGNGTREVQTAEVTLENGDAQNANNGQSGGEVPATSLLEQIPLKSKSGRKKQADGLQQLDANFDFSNAPNSESNMVGIADGQ